MTSLEPLRKCHQELHAHDVRGLAAVRFCPLEEKIVYKTCFPIIYKVKTPITRPDYHAELLKIYNRSFVEKLKFSWLDAKSDLRFKVR